MTINPENILLSLCYEPPRIAVVLYKITLRGGKKKRIFKICYVCYFRQLTRYWILIDLPTVPSVEQLQLSPKVSQAGNSSKRENKCRGKRLAAHVVHWHTCRPTISKQEAITISSIFTAWSPPLSFIHVFLLFCFVSPSHFLIFILFHHSLPSLSSPLPHLVDSGGGCIGSSASMWADKCVFEWGIQPLYVGFVRRVLMFFVHICAATWEWPDAPWWQERRAWHPTARLFHDNGECITHFSHHRLSLWLSLCLT